MSITNCKGASATIIPQEPRQMEVLSQMEVLAQQEPLWPQQQGTGNEHGESGQCWLLKPPPRGKACHFFSDFIDQSKFHGHAYISVRREKWFPQRVWEEEDNQNMKGQFLLHHHLTMLYLNLDIESICLLCLGHSTHLVCPFIEIASSHSGVFT